MVLIICHIQVIDETLRLGGITVMVFREATVDVEING